MRVIVTGASGFLAAHVLSALRRRPDLDVVPVSRRAMPDGVRVLEYDACPSGDVLIHLAEVSDRGQAAALGQPYVRAARHTLSTLARLGFRRVVYASSAVVYGDASATPHDVTDPVSVSDAYTQLKLECESVVRDAGGVVARLGNVYGAGMSPRTVVQTIVNQIPGEGPLRVLDATPVRDFLSGQDAGEGLARLAVTPDLRDQVFNVGTGIGTSVGEVARLALAAAGETHREIISERPAAASVLILDPSRTTAACGWSAQVAPQQGIAEMIHREARACRSG